MALELVGENIMISRIAGRGETSTVLENSIIVPDMKPDISEVLVADGDIFVNSTEASREKVTVSGVMRCKILYVDEGEEKGLNSITSDFPFSREMNVAGAEDGMECYGNCRIEHVEYEIANSRKLVIKAFVNLSCRARQEKAFTAVNDIKGDNDIQILRSEHRVKRYVGFERETAVVSQSLEVPSANPAVKELLRTDVRIGELSTETSENRIVAKGDIHISTLYKTDDLEDMIQQVEHEVPFTQFVDLEGADENSVCETGIRILDERCSVEEDIDGEMRILEAEVELEVTAAVYADYRVEVITDAYSPVRAFRLESEEISAQGFRGSKSQKVPIRETVPVRGDNPEISQVCSVNARPAISGYTVGDGKVKIEGVLECGVLYIPEGEKPIHGSTYEIPFRQEIAVEGLQDGDDCDIDLRVEHINYSILSPGELEIRVTMNIDTITSRAGRFNVIKSVEETNETDTAKKPSILIYFAKRNDSLWNIAKKYCTTIPQIMEANNMDEEREPLPGQQIIVP